MKAIFTTAILLALVSQNAFAEGVYKWTDKEGHVHYTTAAPSKDARPAELPPIMRGEVKLADKKLVTCDKHGGVNCQAGPDSDGSVICFDSFKEASARYRFTCDAPKLEISDIGTPDTNGVFSVFVRNAKSVEAQKMSVKIKLPDGLIVKLAGPDSIAAFGSAEYQYTPANKDSVILKPKHEDLQLTCANCPS